MGQDIIYLYYTFYDLFRHICMSPDSQVSHIKNNYKYIKKCYRKQSHVLKRGSKFYLNLSKFKIGDKILSFGNKLVTTELYLVDWWEWNRD